MIKLDFETYSLCSKNKVFGDLENVPISNLIMLMSKKPIYNGLQTNSIAHFISSAK